MFKHKHVMYGLTIDIISSVVITFDQHCFLRLHFSYQSYSIANGGRKDFTENVALRKNLMTNNQTVSVIKLRNNFIPLTYQ